MIYIGHGKIGQLMNKKVMDMIDEASDDYDKELTI